MILGFAHPCIVVPDANKAKAFYQEMFGFTVNSEEGWSGALQVDTAIGVENSHVTGFMMKGHNCFLEIHQYLSPAQSDNQPQHLKAHELGLRHLAFLVDDCFIEVERLQALGGSKIGEPVAVADGIYAAYCRDPFGNIIELCEPVTENESLTSLDCITSHSNFTGS